MTRNDLKCHLNLSDVYATGRKLFCATAN